MKIYASFPLGFSYADDDYVPSAIQLQQSALIQRLHDLQKREGVSATLASGLLEFSLDEISVDSEYIFDELGGQYHATAVAIFDVPTNLEQKILDVEYELEDHFQSTLDIGGILMSAGSLELVE